MDETNAGNQEEVDPRLEQCWVLLIDVAHSNRPLPNGFQERARLLLESHGVPSQESHQEGPSR